jgi:uncharacterized protein YecT (DUF1311 family)
MAQVGSAPPLIATRENHVKDVNRGRFDLPAGPVADAGAQGDPGPSCDGNTFEMVECLNAKTAQWDKRMTSAYAQALKDAVPQQREQLRAAQRIWIAYRDAIACVDGEGTIARIDAGDCMRNLTEARAHELENVGHQ